jgi:predicted nucleic acid-binding protein
MKNKAIDATIHVFSASDKLLPDANIWIYLNGPASNPGYWAVQAYSAVLGNILKAGAELYLDVLVLSEFINRFARMEMYRLGHRDFKVFRQSADFPPVATAIQQQTSQILIMCQSLDHPFSEWDHGQMLTDFGLGGADWNDQLLVENCRKHGISPLTNDGDFTEGGINVFTANWKLIRACP